MTQQEAAKILWFHFYEVHSSKGHPGEKLLKIRCIAGFAVVPRACHRRDLDARRDKLLPKDFRFTWPDLPKGAHYVVVERGGANTCGRCGWVITAGHAGCHETEPGSGVVVCVAPEQR